MTSNLSSNEVLIGSMPNKNLSEIKKQLYDKELVTNMVWERDLLGRINACLLTFESEEKKEEYLIKKFDIFEDTLDYQVMQKNDENESYFNRVLVVENIPEGITEEELILTIGKHAKIKDCYFPHYLKSGKICSSFDT